MSKMIFSQETIKMLKEKDEVTYISEKSISFSLEFRIKIATCKNKFDVVLLFDSVGICLTIFGSTRLKSLYNRYKSEYRN